MYVLCVCECGCIWVCSAGAQASSPAESGSFHTAASIGSQTLDSSTEVEDDSEAEVVPAKQRSNGCYIGGHEMAMIVLLVIHVSLMILKHPLVYFRIIMVY